MTLVARDGLSTDVMPAPLAGEACEREQAGTCTCPHSWCAAHWVPACAGMTLVVRDGLSPDVMPAPVAGEACEREQAGTPASARPPGSTAPLRRPSRPGEDRIWVCWRMVARPGDELVGADEDEGGLVALAATVAAVSDDLEGNAHSPAAVATAPQAASSASRREKSEPLPQLLEDVAARARGRGAR